MTTTPTCSGRCSIAPRISRGSCSAKNPEKDVSLQVVADHARTVAVMLADGVLPSNEGRGYVLRRILRRAARHGVLLGLERPFLHLVSDTVVAEMGDAFPELRERRAYIAERVRREEERFLETLGKGLAVLEEEVRGLREQGADQMSGDVVFRLYDTYGFPVDLTEDILRGEGLALDTQGFEQAMSQQRARGRAAWKGSGAVVVGEVYSRIAAEVPVEFRGYEGLVMTSAIRALLVGGAPADEARAGDVVEAIVEGDALLPGERWPDRGSRHHDDREWSNRRGGYTEACRWSDRAQGARGRGDGAPRRGRGSPSRPRPSPRCRPSSHRDAPAARGLA